ncbi:MAG: methyltransferase domain-containing protein [Lachnospiraceae bacterium]|nr:methyltransferase domain-containing protein [Lachnospiraceae bacterium]
MKNVVIFGYSLQGTILAREIYDNDEYNLYGFADNSKAKQGFYAYGEPIRSINDLKQLDHEIGISVIIASGSYLEIIEQLEVHHIRIEGVYREGEICKYPFPQFSNLDYSKKIKFYAGDIYDEIHRNEADLIGLSINKADDKHILHDIRKPYPIADNSIDRYEAEEVFEYIDEKDLVQTINEIYRILKKGAVLRVSMPDYYSPYMKRRSMTDRNGNIIFDAGGGGKYDESGKICGGQVFFATYDNFRNILAKTQFQKIDWLCYYTKDEILHKKYINMENGYLNRTDNNKTDDFCLVVDCYKD